MANGSLLRILDGLPPAMRLQGRSRSFTVVELIAVVQSEGQTAEDRPFVLLRCQNGAHAIMRVERDGSVARNASYFEVR